MKSFYSENFFSDGGDLFKGITYPWEALEHLQDHLYSLELGKIEVEIPEGVFLENPGLISIEPGVKLEPGAYIKGPCVILQGSEVRQGAYIRENCLVGQGCVVGHATELKNTIFLDGAKAGHFAYLGDSILGRDVNIGAGVKCANLKLDKSDIYVWCEEGKMATGRRKLGAIVGDRGQVGCNAVLNPGTLTTPETLWYPGIVRGGLQKGKVC